MQKIVQLLARVLIGASLFVPLIVFSKTYIFPFIVPKIVIFRAIVLGLVALYALLLTTDRKRFQIPWKHPLVITVGVFLLSLIVSTFVGVDWYRSLWDNHERMLGLFTIAHYIIYFGLLVALVRDWEEWQWFIRIFLFVGSIVMLIGLWQKVDPTFLLNNRATRVTSTLGNAIYVGGLGIFMIFFSYLSFLKSKVPAWRVYGIVTMLLGLSGLMVSGTRGSLLGLFSGTGVAVLLYIVLMRSHVRLRNGLIAFMILGAVVMGTLFAFRENPTVQKIPALGRLVNTSFQSNTAQTRFMAWGVAIDAWKERPLLGWGPNNYFFAFNKYYRAEFLEHGWKETWFDNAHNIIMNTLAVQGIVGLVSYLGMFVVIIVLLWKQYLKTKKDVHIPIIGTSFLVAHLVQNIFVFENPTSYLYFFFALAFLVTQTPVSAEEKTEEEEKKKRPLSLGVGIFVAVFAMLMLYGTDYRPAQANKATLKMIQRLYANDPNILTEYERVTKIATPHIDDIRMDFARISSGVVEQYRDKGNEEIALKLLEHGYAELEKNKLRHPLDIRINIQQSSIALQQAQILKDLAYLQSVEMVLEDALSKSPKRQQVEYALAQVKVQLGDVAGGVAVMEQSIANDPILHEGWWRLAVIYQLLGRLDDAREVFARAEEHNVVFVGKGEEVRRSVVGEG